MANKDQVIKLKSLKMDPILCRITENCFMAFFKNLLHKMSLHVFVAKKKINTYDFRCVSFPKNYLCERHSISIVVKHVWQFTWSDWQEIGKRMPKVSSQTGLSTFCRKRKETFQPWIKEKVVSMHCPKVILVSDSADDISVSFTFPPPTALWTYGIVCILKKLPSISLKHLLATAATSYFSTPVYTSNKVAETRLCEPLFQ